MCVRSAAVPCFLAMMRPASYSRARFTVVGVIVMERPKAAAGVAGTHLAECLLACITLRVVLVAFMYLSESEPIHFVQ